jgi:SOS-response transcriptional repressor LexA
VIAADDLTPRQSALLGALVSFTEERGYAPSTRDLARQLGTSFGSVHRMLLILRGNGLVSWEEGRARTLRVTDSGTRR